MQTAVSSSFSGQKPAKSDSPPEVLSIMTYLPLSLLDVLSVDALDVHFVNFCVISASYEVRVGRACELALCR